MKFRSNDEFREVIDGVFELMSSDPEMGPRLQAAETPQRFEFPDVDMVVNITYAAGSEAPRHLRWVWSDDIDWEPDVQMTMDADVANRYFQGKENIAMAIAQAADKDERQRQEGARPRADHEARLRPVSRAPRARLPAPAGLAVRGGACATPRHGACAVPAGGACAAS